MQEHLCAQLSSNMESADNINMWESAWRQEGCRVGVSRGSVHILNFSYQPARKSARMIEKKAKK